jgi:ribonuclease E
MLDNEPTGGPSTDDTSVEASTATAPTPRRRAPRRAPKAAPVAGAGTTGAATTTGAAGADRSTGTEVAAATDPTAAADPVADAPAAPAKRTRRAAKKATPVPAAAPEAGDLTAAAVEAVAAVETADGDAPAPAKKAARKAAPRKRAAKKAAEHSAPVDDAVAPQIPDVSAASSDVSDSAAPAPAKRTRRSRSAAGRTDAAAPAAPDTVDGLAAADALAPAGTDTEDEDADGGAPAPGAPPVALFVAPDPTAAAPRRRGARRPAGPPEPPVDVEPAEDVEADAADAADDEAESAENEQDTDGGTRRRRRGRRGRGRGRGSDETANEDDESAEKPAAEDAVEDADTGDDEDGEGGTRRRRRRRRGGSGGGGSESAPEDPPNTVVKVREPRVASDEVQGVKGSTRLEAKRQRRRDGRDQGRRRPPVLSEAEFLARREAVERVMVVRQVGERTQIAVLEDDVLVEHYVTKASNTSYAGNVYLGKVQNVLPSMEAAFIDVGKGRNAVLYAGEVNWDAAGMDGKPRKIEQALKSGDPVLVQVTKDPIGHKGARLTSQISLPGRFLVYVPEGQMTGISRKLPDTERKRLKDILKKIVPENAGVIIRTAAEGASEEELTRDVARLEAQWQTIKAKAEKGQAPSLLYAEPDLVIRVIRDIFNEDFAKLVVSGDEAWDTVQQYVEHVSPDLVDRLSRHTAGEDVFAALRIDEQLTKALDRKVYLPSGGSLVIDRTEAMTVVDVNTGKFTGQGGNLEETVTRNNLEAAEEIVRQLRLRDIGGMIVVDFIDMVLESNRDLVLRRLTECLGRDRTKHQVAEVTSLGLVQMTRKRVGQGLLEAFSETCEHCKGRGVMVRHDLIERPRPQQSAKPQPPRPAPPAALLTDAGSDIIDAEVVETSSDVAGAPDTEAATAESRPAEGGRRRGRGRGGRGQGADSAEAVDAGHGDAGQGEGARGDAGQGEGARGDAGQGDAGQAEGAQGDAVQAAAEGGAGGPADAGRAGGTGRSGAEAVQGGALQADAAPVEAGTDDEAAAVEPRSRRRRGRGRVTTEVVAADVAAEPTPEPPSEAPLGSEPWPAVPAPDVVTAGSGSGPAADGAAVAEVTPPAGTSPIAETSPAAGTAPTDEIAAPAGTNGGAGTSGTPVTSGGASGEASVAGAGATNGAAPSAAPADAEAAPPRRRRRAASRPAGPPVAAS